MVCAMCSSNIAKELDKAAVEHEALVREVEIDVHYDSIESKTRMQL